MRKKDDKIFYSLATNDKFVSVDEVMMPCALILNEEQIQKICPSKSKYATFLFDYNLVNETEIKYYHEIMF